jgi:hypothetical protein
LNILQINCIQLCIILYLLVNKKSQMAVSFKNNLTNARSYQVICFYHIVINIYFNLLIFDTKHKTKNDPVVKMISVTFLRVPLDSN